ncbi:MAG: peptidoglycan-binding protein [Verrucomicrobiota bacterium]|nr:peptidoglycan-binding protein [Verrucomicrobiota bacterium]
MLFLFALPLRADERVRQVQEELRRRNLFFGDVDGQPSPALANALRRYQARKGFDVTGAIDDATATSLDVQPRAAVAAATNPSTPPLPDVPVLKSDSARQLPEQQRIALEKEAEQNPDAQPSPFPPAEAPPPNQNITPARINEFVQQYLRDSETSDIPAQTNYFAYPVEYFDHGAVGPAFVEKDVANYVKRWPQRKYTLTAPPTAVASGKDGETIVEFPITFDVRNNNHVAKGRTRNIWSVRQEGDNLKIVAIRERRLRE